MQEEVNNLFDKYKPSFFKSKRKKNLLDAPIPNLIDLKTPPLQPKKYEPKEEKTLINKAKDEIISLFDKYKYKFKKSVKKPINWLSDLKNNALDIFSNLQKKPVIKFKLDKEALNVTKRYEMDLEKAGLSLYDTLRLLEKIKPLVLEKFKKIQEQSNN